MNPPIYVIAPLLFFSTVTLASPSQLSPAEATAAFKAAGFTLEGGQWRSSCGVDDTDSASYTPGTIEEARDINGDGQPDAVITEGGTFCYGSTGSGFTIVSRQGDGHWRSMFSSQGLPEFLATKGVGGWPDILVGGPGFCFPVMRWNGKAYKQQRFEYEGKKCRP